MVWKPKIYCPHQATPSNSSPPTPSPTSNLAKVEHVDGLSEEEHSSMEDPLDYDNNSK
jgi:hypothetical protein